MDEITPCPDSRSSTASKTTSITKIGTGPAPSEQEKTGIKETIVATGRVGSQGSGVVVPGERAEAQAAGVIVQDDALVPPLPNHPAQEHERDGQPLWSRIAANFRPFLYALTLITIMVVMTGWWVAGLVLHRHDLGWVVPFLVWLAIMLRILALHPPTRSRAGNLFHAVGIFASKWRTAEREALPAFLQRLPNVLPAVITVVIILLGTFVPAESGGNTRGDRAISLLGLVVSLGIFYITSRNRSKINFLAVFGGTAAQFVLGLLVLKTKAGYDIFSFIGEMAKKLLGYSSVGTIFLTDKTVPTMGWFFISVVPAVIFFVAFVQLLQHWGWIGWIVGHFARVFSVLLGISGAEAVVAAASPFIGQGESAVLIRQYMPRLTKSELHQIMTSGFATIAGSVMSAYMTMGISPVAIISSCVMSIPASIALSKMRYPETDEPVTRGRAPLRGAQGEDVLRQAQEQDNMEAAEQDADAPEEERAYNSLYALGQGAWLGLKIAGMIVASVLCIMALLGLVDGLLGWWGSYINVPQVDIQLIMGYLLYPVAFLLGVDRTNNGGGDLRSVAELLGIKIVANEFVAYGDLTTDPKYQTLSPRSRIIVMYALCGFGNFSAVGIQIGALTQLAPHRAADVASVALSALITGIVATLTSASIAGMLIGGDSL